jgi:predicted metalloprotease
MTTTRPRSEPAGSLRLLALAAGTPSLLAIGGAWSWARLHPSEPQLPAAAVAAEGPAILRRTEVAFADAQAVWHRLDPRYGMASVEFFTAATPTPCAGGVAVSGPFYCPESGAAAFDLRFLADLGDRLQRQRDLGLALVAARLAAEHLQRETGVLDAAAVRMVGQRRAGRAAIAGGLALQADCLAGVWAAQAAGRIGAVAPGFWGQLVWSWRNVAEATREAGGRAPEGFDPFASGTRDERAAAFAQGYAAGGLAGCPVPAGRAG